MRPLVGWLWSVTGMGAHALARPTWPASTIDGSRGAEKLSAVQNGADMGLSIGLGHGLEFLGNKVLGQELVSWEPSSFDGPNARHPLLQVFGFLGSVCIAQERRQVVQTGGDGGMVRAEGLL